VGESTAPSTAARHRARRLGGDARSGRFEVPRRGVAEACAAVRADAAARAVAISKWREVTWSRILSVYPLYYFRARRERWPGFNPNPRVFGQARALSSRRTRDTPSDGVRPDASELAKTSTRDARVVDAR
jgi:hypothetical protein